MDEINNLDLDNARAILIAVLRKTGPIEVSYVEFGEATLAMMQGKARIGQENTNGKAGLFGVIEK